MSRTSDYWRDREREWLEQYLKDEAKYAKDVQSIYDYMLDEIEKEINDNFEKYASKEGISMAEAKKRAEKIDIEAYMRKAEKYVKEKDFSDQANKEMRLYNMTMRVNRLELLKAKIGLELTAGHDELVTYTGEKLTERVKDTLRKNAAILGPTVMDVADHKADVIVNSSFHNATFSDRIWQHQDVLRNELTNILSNALIAGRNPREFIPNIRKRFDVSRYQAERLLRTELARVQIEAQKESYKAEGIDEYEYIACGLGDVCDVCRALDGKHFKVSKMVVGENAPPMHPNCHCSTGPYIDSNGYDEWLDSYKEHHMSYSDWIKMHGDSKSGDSLESDFKKFKRGQKFPKEINGALDRKQYIKIRKEYQKATREKFLHGTELGKRIFVQYADQSVIETLLEPKGVRYQDGKLHLNMYNDLHDPRGAATGYFHEFGHQIDEKLGWKFTKDSTLRDKLKNDFYNISNEEIYEEIKTNYKASSVSDMIGGLSRGEIRGRYGHDNDYWKDKSHITSEFFAHFIEAQFDSERRKILESTFPESYNYVKEMLERRKPK